MARTSIKRVSPRRGSCPVRQVEPLRNKVIWRTLTNEYFVPPSAKATAMNTNPLSLFTAAALSLALMAGPAFAQTGGSGGGAGGGAGAGSAGGIGGGADGTGAVGGAAGTTGPLGSGAPNPGLNANTTPGNRIGPGGVPLAAGSSGSNVPTYGTGAGGSPQAIGPARDLTGSSVGSASLGANGSALTSSGRLGCATESQTATAGGSIYQRDTTGLGPAPRIMNEEPGRPNSAATGRSSAGC